MSEHEPDRDRPEHALARAFGDRVARWSRSRGADGASAETARAAAYAASLAVSSGHTCVALADVASEGDPEASRRRLLDSGVVANAADGGLFPLVVDGAGRLYLARYFDYEQRLARSIAARGAAPLHDVPVAARAMLATQFGAGGPPGQRLAAALALLRSLTIVSGGPGTGKTTTVVKILACLLAGNPDARIALAAPTGKAAARLQDAIAAQAQSLPPGIADRLPAGVSTVHRLLGVRADGRAYRYHAENPLPFDVVVVDEASMLDLALAARLLEAIPLDARVLLVGDKDQLSAVEAGAVFAELSSGVAFTPACAQALAALTGLTLASVRSAERAGAHALSDGVVWLTENFRFASDSGIGRFAAEVNAGNADRALDALRGGAARGVRWIDDDGVPPAAVTLACIEAGYAEFLAALGAATRDLPRCFAAFARFRVLCAERRGARGADGINAAMSRRVLAAEGGAIDAGRDAADRDVWFAGRPVMVRANDYVQNLFNGDVGLVLPDAAGAIRVWFPVADGTFRPIAPTRLPEHETAFATTVHKAQGSEFEELLLVLPARATRVVTRELVYTAITRARQRVTLACGAATLEAAVATPTRRDSGLTDRIAEAFARPR